LGALREMARQKKILISIPDSLLDEADNMAYSQNINRSEFIRDAIKSYIREKKKNEIAQRLKKGYEEMGLLNLEYSEYSIGSDSTQLKLYEKSMAESE